jgi:hypothetical protein
MSPVANDGNAAQRRSRLHPDLTDEAMERVSRMLSPDASAVCCDVSFDESGRPIDKAPQQSLTWSEEQQLALGGARGRPASLRLSRRAEPRSNGVAMSTRVER